MPATSMHSVIKTNLHKYASDLSVKPTNQNRWYFNAELLKTTSFDLDLTQKEWESYFGEHIDLISDTMLKELIHKVPGTKGERLVIKANGFVCEKSARKPGFGVAKLNGSDLTKLKPVNRQSNLSLFLTDQNRPYYQTALITLNNALGSPLVKVYNYNGHTLEGVLHYMYMHMPLNNIYADNYPPKALVLLRGLTTVLDKAWRRASCNYIKLLMSWLNDIGVLPAFKMACRVWGRNLTVRELNRIADNFEVLQKLRVESPRLITHALRMAPYLGVSKIELSFLGSVKTSLHEMGLTKGAWKLMDRLSSFHMRDYLAYVMKAGKNDVVIKTRLMFFVNSLSWSNQSQLPESALTDWIKAMDFELRKTGYCPAYNKIPTVLFKGLPKMEVHSVEEATAFINDYHAKVERLPSLFKAVLEGRSVCADAEQYMTRWSEISDYLERSEVGIWQALPQKVTWAILWKRQAEWHEAILAAEKSTKNKYSWTSLVKKIEEDEWTAEALDGGGELWEEGKAMHHCVSSYTHQCRDGKNRIYSIRKNGDRYATLQIQRQGPASWKNVQLRGYCNALIKNPFVIKFADSIAEAYSQAERKEMDAAKIKDLKAA